MNGLLKLRHILSGVLLLAAGAIGLYVWNSRSVDRPLAAAGRPTLSGSIQRSEAIPAAPEPAKPAQEISSVRPGNPMFRTVSAPPQLNAQLPNPARVANAAPSPGPQPEAREALADVQLMLRDFRSRMGENPVGSNAEIMQAVMGNNPARATLGPPAGQNLNSQGELVDRWGTPYFFHQLSKTQMEIRSAGPDLRMWTADDVQ